MAEKLRFIWDITDTNAQSNTGQRAQDLRVTKSKCVPCGANFKPR